MISEKTPYLNYRLSFVFTVFLPRYLSQNFNEHAFLAETGSKGNHFFSISKLFSSFVEFL